jgi:hypothetical protein
MNGKKIVALKIYEKELGQLPHPRSLKAIEALAIKEVRNQIIKKLKLFR